MSKPNSRRSGCAKGCTLKRGHRGGCVPVLDQLKANGHQFLSPVFELFEHAEQKAALLAREVRGLALKGKLTPARLAALCAEARPWLASLPPEALDELEQQLLVALEEAK